MKVLFISSGNSGKISSIVLEQANSLKAIGIEVDFFAIKGKGIFGYLKNIRELHQFKKGKSFDIYHAHYSFCGFVAYLAGCKPLVVSLMGSDIKSNPIFRPIVKMFINYFWEKTIVKSADMKTDIGIESLAVIPNGVNTNLFKPIDRKTCLEALNWYSNKTHILFAADARRTEKNYALAKRAVELLQHPQIELHTLQNVPFEKMPIYFNAADIVLLTSLWEGSPNVIKEAMACNKPIVTVRVGDVAQTLGNTQGTYICTFEPDHVKQQLEHAIAYAHQHQQTTGRDRIDALGLNSQLVANKLAEIYKSCK